MTSRYVPGVSAAPLDVGPTIRDQLIGPLAAAVLTSATLTSEGSFRYVRDVQRASFLQ